MGNKPGSSAKEAVATEKDVRRLAKGTPYDTANVKNLLARFTKIAAASPDPTQIQEQQVRVGERGAEAGRNGQRLCELACCAQRECKCDTYPFFPIADVACRFGQQQHHQYRETALGDSPG